MLLISKKLYFSISPKSSLSRICIYANISQGYLTDVQQSIENSSDKTETAFAHKVIFKSKLTHIIPFCAQPETDSGMAWNDLRTHNTSRDWAVLSLGNPTK